MTLPVGGQRHERAVEALAAAVAERPAEWFHKSGEPVTDPYRNEARRLIAELERQGVRLVEQPKCPECEGKGWVHPEYVVTSRTCQRCGGSGYEPLVALSEAERLREALLAIARVPHNGDGDSRECANERGRIARLALARRFGGGER